MGVCGLSLILLIPHVKYESFKGDMFARNPCSVVLGT